MIAEESVEAGREESRAFVELEDEAPACGAKLQGADAAVLEVELELEAEEAEGVGIPFEVGDPLCGHVDVPCDGGEDFVGHHHNGVAILDGFRCPVVHCNAVFGSC